MTTSERESSTPFAPGFSIAVPGDWIIVDLELAEDPQLVLEIVDRRVTQGIIKDESRDAAAALVTRVAQQATENGVRFAAVLVVQEQAGPTVASFTAMTAVLRTSEPEDISAEAHADAIPGDAEQNDPAKASSKQEVTLPAGPALRVERVVAYPLSHGVDQEVYAVQYVVPVGNAGDAIILSGISPAIRRKDDLDRLFQEIAETLEIERP